jgi:hypothetical protein
MNKKILAKTLLPIATVALLGGGIASSLVACSKQDKIINLTVSNLQANGILGTESSTLLTFTTSAEITGLNSDDVISSISTVNIDNVSYDSSTYTVAISGT